jgi:D-glycero-D-manno-heptose 1,7-bisphosphate phosphatase
LSHQKQLKRAVFLDRDGVINRAIVRDGKPYPPSTLDEFELLPGAERAMRDLKKAGFVLIVVTNQPDVSSGLQTREVVEEMHKRLSELCDAVKVCYHTDADRCECRKPKPGMILEAARAWDVDPSQSFVVGDRWRDIAAGRAAGCYTLLIDRRYREREAEHPDAIVSSLEEAAKIILGGTLTRTRPE